MLGDEKHPLLANQGINYNNNNNSNNDNKNIDNVNINNIEKGAIIGYPKYYIPRRYIMVLLCFLATIVCYWLRTNMSMAIIPMQAHFGWSSSTKGVILSSFFWGYICLQLPGSWIATRLGGKLVLGVGVLMTSVFTLLTPFAAEHLPFLLLCRFCTGFAEAVTYPVIGMMLAEWAAPEERTMFITIVWCGGNLGTVISMVTTSPLIAVWGWRKLFYFNGATGLLWTLLWFLLAANQPHQFMGICAAELKYIHTPTSAVTPAGAVDGKPTVTLATYKMLLSSKHVWACVIANFCCNWGFYVLLTWIPTYINEELHFDLTKAGFIAVVPYLGLFVTGIVGGKCADSMIRRGVELSLVRKTFGVLGCALPAFFLIGLSFIYNVHAAIVCMALAVSLSGINYSSYSPNILDIAPKYAGVIMGVSNTFGTIPGIVAVYLTGLILDWWHSWAIVFILAGGIYLVNCVTWSILCTAKRLF